MFVLTEDQAVFKDVVGRFFSDKSPVSAVRQLMESQDGFDRDMWLVMSESLGLPGLHIPEQYGGYGFGMVELGLVLEAMGRHVYCGPYFGSSLMSGFMLTMSADESAKQRLLPQLASGEKIFSLVLDDLDDYSSWGKSLKVSEDKLTGAASIVLDAGIADRLLVVAAEGENLGLYEVDQSEGVSIRQREVIDPTRKIYSVEFANAHVNQIGVITQQQARDLWNTWSLCLAHEMLGGAQHLLDSTVEYTKLRYQFGRAIGSFQSLKHRCADLLMELELAKGVVSDATQSAVSDNAELYLPSMAKAMASDAYMSIAKSAIQLRGGIGFTWENDTHLWFKRAKSSEVFLGTASAHRENVIALIEESGYAA